MKPPQQNLTEQVMEGLDRAPLLHLSQTDGSGIIWVDKTQVVAIVSSTLQSIEKQVLGVVDGHKEVYTEKDSLNSDVEEGVQKDHVDSCCNETIDEIIIELSKLFRGEK